MQALPRESNRALTGQVTWYHRNGSHRCIRPNVTFGRPLTWVHERRELDSFTAVRLQHSLQVVDQHHRCDAQLSRLWRARCFAAHAINGTVRNA
jgi:hypothetical protein